MSLRWHALKQQFGCDWLPISCEAVLGYGRSLPSSALHDDDNWVLMRARFTESSAAQPVGWVERSDTHQSRRPLILARRADDLCAERRQKTVQFIDVGTLAGAEAEVMQTDALLLERCAFMLG